MYQFHNIVLPYPLIWQEILLKNRLLWLVKSGAENSIALSNHQLLSCFLMTHFIVFNLYLKFSHYLLSRSEKEGNVTSHNLVFLWVIKLTRKPNCDLWNKMRQNAYIIYRHYIQTLFIYDIFLGSGGGGVFGMKL